MTFAGALFAALAAGLLMGLLVFVVEPWTLEAKEKRRLEEEKRPGAGHE